MNIQTVKDFMEIFPWLDKCMYQTFDDAKTGKDLVRAWKYLMQMPLEQLQSLNEKWAGIFFSVNGNDNESRKQADVTHINAWITEIDHLSKKDQMAMIDISPIKPSLIVESKNWYHLYRFAKEWTVENRRKICRWLRNFFEWDPAVITEERILRVPWFDHCKDTDRFEISMVWWDLQPHTELEMLTAFSNFETHQDRKDKLAKSEAYQKKYETDNDDNFWKRVWDIDSQQMLDILSGSKYVNGDIFTFKRNWEGENQIWVNWKTTWCRIDSAGKIWTQKWAGWWPTRKQRVWRYGTFDWKWLYDLIIDRFPAFKPKVKTQTETVQKVKDIVDGIDYLVPYNREFQTNYSDITPFTWWTEWIDDRFWRVDRWVFLTTIWESWSGKTTFAFHQLLQLSKKYKVLFISLEMDWERVIRLRARKMAGITKQQWDNKSMSPSQLEIMERNIDLIKSNKNLEIVWINTTVKSIDIDLILASILKKYMEFDFITIDNLWFIKAEWQEKKMDERTEANYIIRKIKFFCQDNKKTINLLHHFNKWNSANRRERTFSDVMMTSKLEHDIDYAIFISRAVFNPNDFEEATPQERAMVFVDLMKDRDEWVKQRQIIYFTKWWYSDNFNF